MLQTDPKSPDYDPLKLLVVEVPARRIFRAEPRDPVWAPRRAATLKRLFAEDVERLVKDGKVTSVECRTASCEVKAESEHGQADVRPMMQALQIRELGALGFDTESVVTEGSHTRFSMIAMFDHERHDDAGFVAYVARKTAELPSRFDGGAP